jgi:hypothetical protein
MKKGVKGQYPTPRFEVPQRKDFHSQEIISEALPPANSTLPSITNHPSLLQRARRQKPHKNNP